MIVLYIIAAAIILFGVFEAFDWIRDAVYQARNPYSKLLRLIEEETNERESGRSIQRDDQGTDREQ